MHRHKCFTCGIEFETRKKTSKFCSRSCQSKDNVKATQKMVKKKCIICGKEFIGKPNKKYDSAMCSRKANNKSCLKMVSCVNCGKKFETRHHKTQKCCSLVCGNELKSRQNTVKKTCKRCGEVFYVKKCRDKKYNVTYCSIKCYGKTNISSYEHEIKCVLENLGIRVETKYKPKWLLKKEIDIYLPDLKIGIEFNGVYWHSESAGKDRKYHFNKSKLCAENGVRLIHIFEDDWKNKKDVVVKRLSNLVISSSDVVYARNCVVEFGGKDEINKFIKEYHTQGSINFEYGVVLLHDDKIVSALTFGKQRKVLGSNPEDGKFEILRYCSSKRVIGGFSKMLSFFIKSVSPKEIITFMDLDWNFDVKNNVYAKNGFTLSHVSPPNYWYVNKEMVREHRFKYRKSELTKRGYSKNSSESKIMEDLGFWKVWNCGSAKFKMLF